MTVGYHYSLPGTRLPSQPQKITALRPSLNDTAWQQRNMGENTEQLAQRPYMSMEMASDETWEFLIMNPMACM